MIEELEQRDIYEYIAGLANAVRDGLSGGARNAGFKVQVTGIGSVFHIHFTDKPTRGKRSAMRADSAKQYEFSMGMISKGVLLVPLHLGLPSAAHTDEDVEEILRTAGEVLREMAS